MKEAQFRSCVMPLSRRMYAYALSILGNESDAADCIQEALTRLWEHRSRLKDANNLEAYVMITVRNLALNSATRHHPNLSALSDQPPDLADLSPDPGETVEQHEQLKAMADMIRSLPDNQRKVVTLSAVSGLSNSEISDVTGLSDDNVRVLLSRGRKKLRQLFSNLYGKT